MFHRFLFSTYAISKVGLEESSADLFIILIFCRIYPKYRNANTYIVTNDTEIGHLYQLCSLIRICTISYLANNLRKTIIIIMFKLKNKNDNHFYIDIAMGIY